MPSFFLSFFFLYSCCPFFIALFFPPTPASHLRDGCLRFFFLFVDLSFLQVHEVEVYLEKQFGHDLNHGGGSVIEQVADVPAGGG